MQDSGRIQAIIDILTQFHDNHDQPADRMVGEYFKTRRYIGAKDRQFISEHFFTILRQYFLLVSGLDKPTPRLIVARYANDESIFNGEDYGPDELSSYEKPALKKANSRKPTEADLHATPDWVFEMIKRAFPKTYELELEALNVAAKTDFRVNPIKTSRDLALAQLHKESIDAEPTPYSPFGIRLLKRQNLKNHPLFLNGALEVQDEGAQILSLLCDVKPSMRVLDYCAGAGGKTLMLAALMQNTGKIVATDIHDWRLERAKMRFKRAGLHNTETRVINKQWTKRQKDNFDRVLIDVPCSGTGTWRRNPDVRIRMTKDGLDAVIQTQRDIMDQTSGLVKIGGCLIYATCSILREENHDQIAWFLEHNPNYELVPFDNMNTLNLSLPGVDGSGMLQMTPRSHEFDGFFIACLERKS